MRSKPGMEINISKGGGCVNATGIPMVMGRPRQSGKGHAITNGSCKNIKGTALLLRRHLEALYPNGNTKNKRLGFFHDNRYDCVRLG